MIIRGVGEHLLLKAAIRSILQKVSFGVVQVAYVFVQQKIYIG
jgi:hypothetical protein